MYNVSITYQLEHMENMALIRTAIALALAMAGVESLAASIWSKEYSVDYVMGDGDSRATARQAAIAQITLKAGSESGTYLQGTTTLKDNDAFTETIDVLRASVIKIDKVSENITLNKNGQTVLHLRATADVDEGELEKRISILRNDRRKEKEIAALTKQVTLLKEQLDAIEASYATQDQPPGESLAAYSQQAAIREQLRASYARIDTVFINHANIAKAAIAQKHLLDTATRYLENALVKPALATQPDIKIENVQYLSDNTAKVTLETTWRFSTLNRLPEEYHKYIKYWGLYKNSSTERELIDAVNTLPALQLELNINGKKQLLPHAIWLYDMAGPCNEGELTKGSYMPDGRYDRKYSVIVDLSDHNADPLSITAKVIPTPMCKANDSHST